MHYLKKLKYWVVALMVVCAAGWFTYGHAHPWWQVEDIPNGCDTHDMEKTYWCSWFDWDLYRYHWHSGCEPYHAEYSWQWERGSVWWAEG